MKVDELKELVLESLDDLKGKDIVTLDVRELTGMTDYMIICTGTSNRHVKSLAGNVALDAKKKGCPALGVEGENAGEWVLVDFGDIVVHVMLGEAREFYELEKLWSVPAA